MRTIFILCTLLSFILQSCTSEKKQDNAQREKTIIPVPEVFEKDTAIARHMTDLSENLDAFAIMVEDMADEIEALQIKDIKKPGITERLRLMQIVLPRVSPMMETVEKLQKLAQESETIKDTLSEERLNAFNNFEQAFKGRFDTLNLRFRSYLSEDTIAKQ